MKIAYVFAYLGDGGTEDHAILLAKKAKESGCEPFFIISSYSESGIKKLKAEDIKIHNLPMESSFSPLSVLRSAVGLKKIIKQERVDIIHVHMLREQSLAIMAKIFGSKVILIRTFHRFDQFNWKMRFLMPVYRKYTDAFISISEAMGSYLKNNGLMDRVYLINNGVIRVKVSKHAKAIGFIGRLTKEKGILEFIKANKNILHDNKLVIAGDGPELEYIKNAVRDNKLNVEIMGNVSDKVSFYEKISVLILPSETEVLPLVVLEAYSCGLPVIAFDINSLRGLISKDNGILTKYLDYKQMGQDALGLLSDSNRYRKNNMSKYESSYSDSVMWDKTYKLYQSKLDRQ